MKLNNIPKILLGGTIVVLAGCSENAWNDKMLDGFEEPVIEDVETVTYTMTASDISKLASLKKNIELAQAAGQLQELAAVAAQGYFTETITPQVYAPAWLDSLAGVKGSPVYYLDNGSTLQLSFPTSQDLPAELTQITAGKSMTVSEEQYQTVWGSETDYTEAFAPAHTAASEIPGLLATAYPDADADTYAVVTYNVAAQNPNFGSSDTPTPEVPFEQSSVIGTAKVGDDLDIAGIVTAICTRGYIVTDKSGSMLVYVASGFVMDDYTIGTQIKVSGAVSAYNGGLQLTIDTEEKAKTEAVVYPAATLIDKNNIAELAEEINGGKNSGITARYVTVKGTNKKSGTYNNIYVEGIDNFDVSLYYAPTSVTSLLTDGLEVNLSGYLSSRSGSNHLNIIVTEFNGAKVPETATAKTAAVVSRGGVEMTTTTESAVYQFNGSKWAAVKNITVLTHDDYVAMNQSRDNINATAAATYLPLYFQKTYPYAQDGDTRYVVYNFYNGSTTVNNYVSRGEFVENAWTVNTINTEMSQFVLTKDTNGYPKWIYDPSIYIDLPSGRNSSSAPFYQACVDWVYNNVDVPEFGSTSITSGVGYVTSFGNNEYYAGTSAYQGNVDLRPTAAKGQTPSIYSKMSDDEIVSTMKKHFEENVMPAVLHEMYPDAQPGNGVNQYYVISFVMYNGSSHDEVIRYLVTAPGTFEFVDCTWNDAE
ncbi:MAG: hypothetical protein K2J42_09985 [Muribaculaceae bacterium]|nr:hypothetical protein [Muribaculaceae bacterium]